VAKTFAKLLLLGSAAVALEAMAMGSAPAERPYEQTLGLYYDTTPLGKAGDWVFIGTYLSANPLATDEVLRYGFNCSTGEYELAQGLQAASPAVKLNTSDAVFTIADKVCGWSKKSFWQKLFS
jgi:hypothetical protein